MTATDSKESQPLYCSHRERGEDVMRVHVLLVAALLATSRGL